MITADTTDASALLAAAIRQRRLVSFELDGCRRLAEPHDFGIAGGVPRLLFYQVGGESRSGAPRGWRWATLPKIAALAVLDERFAGPRPAPSGRHRRWDRLIASVSAHERSSARGGKRSGPEES